jgi:hypothetical protein
MSTLDARSRSARVAMAYPPTWRLEGPDKLPYRSRQPVRVYEDSAQWLISRHRRPPLGRLSGRTLEARDEVEARRDELTESGPHIIPP